MFCLAISRAKSSSGLYLVRLLMWDSVGRRRYAVTFYTEEGEWKPLPLIPTPLINAVIVHVGFQVPVTDAGMFEDAVLVLSGTVLIFPHFGLPQPLCAP